MTKTHELYITSTYEALPGEPEKEIPDINIEILKFYTFNTAKQALEELTKKISDEFEWYELKHLKKDDIKKDGYKIQGVKDGMKATYCLIIY